MLPSHSWTLLNTKSIAAVCLLLVSLGSAEQLTLREIAFLRDSGLMKPEDVLAAYDRQLSNDKVQRYRSAVEKLMGGADRKAVEAFLDPPEINASQTEKHKATQLSALTSKGTCPPDACKNMAICVPSESQNASRTFTCLCPDGFFGEACQYDVIECVQEPCLHDGDCRKDATAEKAYVCICSVGFTGAHCEIPVSLSETKAPSEDVSRDPIFFTYIAIWCLLALFCGLSLVISVEAERRILFERYKLYTALGYTMSFPRLDFLRMSARVIRGYLCCFGSCIPEEDPGYPTSSSAPQAESTPSRQSSSQYNKP